MLLQHIELYIVFINFFINIYNIMESHNYNLKDKIINLENFRFNRNPPQGYELYDKVISYFDGYDRKVIPLLIALSYPILYDTFLGPDKETYSITIAVCPFTLTAAAFEGKFEATQYVENSCLVITDGKNTFPIINSFNNNIKKFQIDIKILRNVFTEYPDCKYMKIIDDIIIKPILDIDYYKNDQLLFKYTKPNQFHPKTIVYLIHYISSKDHSSKTTVIVGRDANTKYATGYNLVKSGVHDYLVTYSEKIKEKIGFVMPTMWFAWKSFFPDSKIIYIP